jgi:hypothetical protein
MCDFLSAIYIRRSEGKYDLLSAPGKTDSHSELERMYGLNPRKDDQYVKVEFIPDYDDIGDITKWRFILDEQRRPDWFDDDREHDCKAALNSLVGTLIKTEGYWEAKDDFVIACGSATVVAYDNAKVTAYSSSTVTACDSSTVTAYGSSKVTACDSSTVTAYDSSTVTAWNSSTVTAWNSSTVTAWNSSTVTARNSSTVTARDSSTVTARNSSTVTARDSSTVTSPEQWGSDNVTVSQFATWVNHKGKTVVVPDGYKVEVCV